MIDLNLADEFARLIDAGRVRPADIPVSYVDQIAAAYHAQLVGLNATAARVGSQPTHGDSRGRAIAWLFLGQCEPCQHLVDDVSNRTARPAFALPALARVVCVDCWRSEFDADTDALLDLDDECDICGQSSPDHLLRPLNLVAANVNIAAFLCEKCVRHVHPAPGRRAGRNERCRCGSGRKRKHCCGRRDV